MATQHHDQNINDRYSAVHERVGSVSSAFAGLEEELINAFSLLVNDGNLWIGRTIAGRINFSIAVDLFEELGRDNLDAAKALSELDSLVVELRRVSRLRNQVIHSAWYLTGAESYRYSPQPARMRKARGPSIYDEEDHLKALDRLCAEIVDLQDRLVGFVFAYLT